MHISISKPIYPACTNKNTSSFTLITDDRKDSMSSQFHKTEKLTPGPIISCKNLNIKLKGKGGLQGRRKSGFRD